VKASKSKLIGQSGKASVALTSWEELIHRFQRSFTEETELVFVNELRRLANMAEKDQIGPLDAETLGNTALATQVVFYAKLADAIADAAAEKGYFVFDNALRRGAVGAGYSTKYGRIQRFKNTWIGFDAHSWSKYGESPVWVGFDNKSDIEGKLAEIFKKAGLKVIVDNPDTAPMLLVPVFLTPDVGQDELIEKAVEQVEKICSLLK
jgi:hypothetical protein